jgi:hypothetical protein
MLSMVGLDSAQAVIAKKKMSDLDTEKYAPGKTLLKPLNMALYTSLRTENGIEIAKSLNGISNSELPKMPIEMMGDTEMKMIRNTIPEMTAICNEDIIALFALAISPDPLK